MKGLFKISINKKQRQSAVPVMQDVKNANETDHIFLLTGSNDMHIPPIAPKITAKTAHFFRREMLSPLL